METFLFYFFKEKGKPNLLEHENCKYYFYYKFFKYTHLEFISNIY